MKGLMVGGLLSAKVGGSHRFYVPDMQGHVRQVTDVDGDAIAEYQDDAGGLIQLTAASALAFGDWGYTWDGKPGRYYVQQRHLRVDQGRWMSVDPVETEPPYLYVGDRPTWAVDPSGEQAQWVDPNTQKLIGLPPGSRIGPLRPSATRRSGPLPHNQSARRQPRGQGDASFAALRGLLLLGIANTDALIEECWRYNEALLRTMAENSEDYLRDLRSRSPMANAVLSYLPLPTPLGIMSENQYRAFLRPLGREIQALAPPFPTDPAFLSWDVGFAWGVAGVAFDLCRGALEGTPVVQLADLTLRLAGLRQTPDVWGGLGQFLRYWRPILRSAYVNAVNPDSRFDAGKTVGVAVAYIALTLDAVVGIARFAGAVAGAVRAGGGLARLARDPIAFANELALSRGKGSAPLTSGEKAALGKRLRSIEERTNPRVYRVQGGAVPPRISHERIRVGPSGNIHIVPEPGKSYHTMLYVTVDDPARARIFLAERRQGGHIVSFEVDGEFVAELRQVAVSQAEGAANPDLPQFADPTKTSVGVRERLGPRGGESSGYGLPSNWIQRLERAARPGTARMER